MHFNALRGFAVSGFMLKICQIEIGAKHAIDTRKKVQIECGGKPQRVIVGCKHSIQRLHKIRAQKEHIGPLKIFSDSAEKSLCDFGFEVTDRTAEEQYEHRCAGLAQLGGGRKASDIGILDRNDLDISNIVEVAQAPAQRGGRQIDWTIGNSAFGSEIRKYFASFVSRSASQLNNNGGMPGAVRQLARMLVQQTQVGARQAIFWKQGDCFKKSSSKIVIKIF